MNSKIRTKKSMGFIVNVIPILAIAMSLTLFFNSCQKGDDLPENKVANKFKSTLLANEGLFKFFQNALFVREAGKPITVKRQIGNADINYYESCFKLHVQSGVDDEDFVSSATVKIDGKAVLNTSDFNNASQSFQFDLCNLTETSVMEVEIFGKPGSTLEIWIDGKPKNSGTFTDERDGNEYKWIRIGSQIWMAENLRTTKNSDGTDLINVQEEAIWNTLSTGAYCWYGNDIANKYPYGALYNWYAVNTEKLSPQGWHVPTDEEWHTLILSFDPNAGDDIETRNGDYLREQGTVHWYDYPYGTNKTGFTALPAGIRLTNGASFVGLGWSTCWWTSTENPGTGVPWYRNLANGSGVLGRLSANNVSKKDGFSIRCVKN
jgi:uncharacterized protein (TIGR02145 family)